MENNVINEKVVGDRIKELREERGLGQVELAEKLQVSKGIVSLWENHLRFPGYWTIIALVKFFGVSADYLLGISME